MPDDQLSQAALEVLDENGKPFWMKFFKEDYLEGTVGAPPIAPGGGK
jgi:hypothetical protein